MTSLKEKEAHHRDRRWRQIRRARKWRGYDPSQPFVVRLEGPLRNFARMSDFEFEITIKGGPIGNTGTNYGMHRKPCWVKVDPAREKLSVTSVPPPSDYRMFEFWTKSGRDRRAKQFIASLKPASDISVNLARVLNVVKGKKDP